MTEEIYSPRNKLMDDLKVVISDTEDLLKMTANQVGDKAIDLRGRMQVRLEQAKAELVRAQEAAVARAKVAGQAADAYVHENPWRAVGIGAGVGLVVGVLLARR